jgi:hypothetical protein
MRFKIRFRPGRRQNPQVVEEVTARLRAPLSGPLGPAVVKVMRHGAGSVEEQIQRRTYYDRQGGRRPWVEPSITGNRRPEPVVAREQVLWDAALGRSSAGSTRIESHSVALVVDDREIARQAAEIGNKIVSPADYFDFVTGGWDKRTSPALAKPAKPSRRPGVTAMGAFLGFAFDVRLTDEQLEAGIPTPPKNIGINPVMTERAARLVLNYVGTGRVTEPSGTRQLALTGVFGAAMARGARQAGMVV